MKISISGKHLRVGPNLQQHVKDSLEEGISKYFENAISADVHFSKEHLLFVVDIMVNEGTGTQVVIKAQAKEDEIYAAFDKSCERIEKQLRRYKRKLKNHHGKLGISEAFNLTGTKYVISDQGQEDIEGEDDNPLIIAEKQTQIDRLSVSDAVMRMNLANLPALMFINSKTNHVNIVYKRLDGNISWVDSNVSSAADSKPTADGAQPQLRKVAG
jgi:ribosomal subunit interface protein